MYSFTAFLNSSLVGNNGFVHPERVTGAGVTSAEGLLLGKLLGLLDGSVDSWMAVMVISLGLLDGFVDGFLDEVLLGAGVGEWHDAKHKSWKSCSS